MEMVAISCERCGVTFQVSEDTAQARKRRNMANAEMCVDCRDIRQIGACRAWLGDVDDNFAPLKNGQPYLPGIRTCGRIDCVTKAHIVSVAEVKYAKPTVINGVKLCSKSECEGRHWARGLCKKHFMQWNRANKRLFSIPVLDGLTAYVEDVEGLTVCRVPDCGRPHAVKGMCADHYKAVWRKVQEEMLKGALRG